MEPFLDGFFESLADEYVHGRRSGVGEYLRKAGSASRAYPVSRMEEVVRRATETAVAELCAAAAAGQLEEQLMAMESRAPGRRSSATGGSRSRSGSGSGRGDRARGSSRCPHLGGAVLRAPCRRPSESPLRACTELLPTDEFGDFPKMIVACGITYIGMPDVTDAFMLAVASLTTELFAPTSHTDGPKQAEVMSHCYCYRACCPVVVQGGRKYRVGRRTRAANSVCDVIFTGHRRPEKQAMEVLEHVLHHVTDVGMHYAFPSDWGLCETSRLHAAMKEAIRKRCYNVKCYEEEIRDPEELLRVELQEFGYWLITTAWDMQQEFGHDSKEWTLRRPADLAEQLPLAQALFAETVRPTLAAPESESMRALARFAAQSGTRS